MISEELRARDCLSLVLVWLGSSKLFSLSVTVGSWSGHFASGSAGYEVVFFPSWMIWW